MGGSFFILFFSKYIIIKLSNVSILIDIAYLGAIMVGRIETLPPPKNTGGGLLLNKNEKEVEMVKNENFIAIQGWMVNELKLKGNSLLIYAIIYGFSQTEGQVFSGSLQYLADWTNSTKQGVMNCLKKLVDDGLIIKNEKFINGVKFVEYYTTKFNGVLNKVGWGIKQSLMNNIDNNIEHNIDNDTKVSLDKSEYGNENINKMFDKWNEIFGYKPKNSAASRRAIYNMLRAKDKGEDWLVKTMLILREAQKDKYAGNAVLSIADFADLQQRYDKIWQWGSGAALRNTTSNTNIDI